MNMHDAIIDNKEQYTAQELADYIRQGVVTLDELKSVGLDASVRHEIEEILKTDPEEGDWQHACNLNTEEAYKDYLVKYQTGNYRSEAKKAIQSLQKESVVPIEGDEETAYKNINWNDIQSLKDFIDQYPKSKNRRKVKKKIKELEYYIGLTGVERIQEIIKKYDPWEVPDKIDELIRDDWATDDDVIKIFRNDHNVLRSDIVLEFSDIIDFNKLLDAGVNKAFIDELNKGGKSLPPSNLNTIVPSLVNIPDGFTEIYFWGVPASGKTCAVGAIMAALKNAQGVKSVRPISDSQGASYMMPLANSFRYDQDEQNVLISVLPDRTKVEETFEMRYMITDEHGKEHGLAFIDLSGELFECMYKSRAQGRGNLSDQQNEALDVLDNILVNNKSTNPKIHFFVIEYGSENKDYGGTDFYKGLSQNDLLSSCLDYLDDYHILEENTIGAYIIITKADKAGGADIGQYVDDHYQGFYSGLCERMTKWGINTRKGNAQVKRFPFSIGDVCFMNWCLYDPEWTQYIIEEIRERSYGKGTGWLNKLIDEVKK